MTAAPATTAVLAICRRLGFSLAGVTQPSPTRWADELRAWLAAGKHGEMEYLARNLDLRLDPANLLEGGGARSIICVADRYHRGERDRVDPAAAKGRIARYARGDDYHIVMKQRLHALCDELASVYPDEQFRACVDTAPILEREIAENAGLGAVGKHTLLIGIGANAGSYLFLGEVITTLVLEPSCSLAAADPCGSCTRCIDACPTDAITPWSVDASKCISYLTIEHRSAIDPRYHEQMGDWIFGCDICQEVCPHNQPTRRRQTHGPQVNPAYAPRQDSLDLLEVLNWDEEARRDAFTRSAMKRAKLPMMKRNALIAAGNALRQNNHPALRERIAAIAVDETEDAMVRETARQVLRGLADRRT